jgi:hypothetical protein
MQPHDTNCTNIRTPPLQNTGTAGNSSEYAARPIVPLVALAIMNAVGCLNSPI